MKILEEQICQIALRSPIVEVSVIEATSTLHTLATIKPLDTDILKKDVKLVVSVEEHSIIGGLGSAIAEALSTYSVHAPLLRLGIGDYFSQVGEYEYLLEQHGLSPEHIANSYYL